MPNPFFRHSKTLAVLVFPILITQLAQAGYGVIDSIMAGRVSAADLAAVSIGAGVWLPLFLFALGVLLATIPLVGELAGNKNLARIPFLVQQSLWIALGIGILFMGILNLIPLFFDTIGVPTELQTKAKLYLQGVSLGFPAICLYTTLRCYTEALSRPTPVTVISIIGVLSNIPANYVFIYGKLGLPALGGAGCGFATAVVLWLNLGLLALYLGVAAPYESTRFFKQFALPSYPKIKTIIKLGLPIGVAIFFEASLFSLASLVISPLGKITLAAHQITLSVTSQLFMIPLSIALALTILISQAYGEKNFHKLFSLQKAGFIWATSFAVCTMLIIALFRSQLITLFNDNPEVQQTAMTLLLFALAYQLFDAWQVTAAGVLRGLQDTSVPMVITFISYWLVAFPTGIYLSRIAPYGAAGFWTALIIGLGLAAVLLTLRLRYLEKRYCH